MCLTYKKTLLLVDSITGGKWSSGQSCHVNASITTTLPPILSQIYGRYSMSFNMPNKTIAKYEVNLIFVYYINCIEFPLTSFETSYLYRYFRPSYYNCCSYHHQMGTTWDIYNVITTETVVETRTMIKLFVTWYMVIWYVNFMLHIWNT